MYSALAAAILILQLERNSLFAVSAGVYFTADRAVTSLDRFPSLHRSGASPGACGESQVASAQTEGPHLFVPSAVGQDCISFQWALHSEHLVVQIEAGGMQR